MPSERDSVTLREMLRHIELAEKFAQGRSYEDLHKELMPLFAIVRCLEIISEASRRLSDELKAPFADSLARNGCRRKFLSPQVRGRSA